MGERRERSNEDAMSGSGEGRDRGRRSGAERSGEGNEMELPRVVWCSEWESRRVIA